MWRNNIESIWHVVGTVPRNPVIISHIKMTFLCFSLLCTFYYMFILLYKVTDYRSKMKLPGSVLCLNIKTSTWLVHLTVHFWVFKSNGWFTLFFSGTVRIWHSSTYRLESTLNYGMERVWCVASLRGSNNVALGYDEGSIIVKVISHCTVSE